MRNKPKMNPESSRAQFTAPAKIDCVQIEKGTPFVALNIYRWVVALLLWMVCFFSYADRQAFFSIFPLLQKEMKLTTVQLGLLGSSSAEGAPK